MIQSLITYLSFPFVRYAFIAGALIAFCSSLLGVTLVLKRFSFIGDGLSHVAFGAVAIATVLSISNSMIVVLPVTVICAALILFTGNSGKIKGDAAVAMISVGALAFGYLLMHTFPQSANVAGDVCSTLFGSTLILTLTKAKVCISVIMSVAVCAVFVIMYNRIFSVTFDEDFSSSAGINVPAINTVIAVITAVVIVLAMNLVGSLLVSALIIFPALSAMRVFDSFKSVTICAAALSVFCAVGGIALSIMAETPVGPTVVVADILAFLIFTVIGKIKS